MPPWCHRVTRTGTSGTRIAARGGQGWCVQQDRASSGSAVLAASPTEVSWQWGHSPALADQGWLSPRSLWDPDEDLLTGCPGRGVSPPPCLILFSLCVSPALSSSGSLCKQFQFGWGWQRFIGLTQGAKILFIQGRFLFSFQKLLLLPGGSFFSCHSIPPLLPCS